jgi:hypothetical protein
MYYNNSYYFSRPNYGYAYGNPYRLNFSRRYPRVVVNFSTNPPDRNPVSTAVGRGVMGSMVGGTAGLIGTNLLLRHNPDLAIKAAEWIVKPEHIEYGINHLPGVLGNVSTAVDAYTKAQPFLSKIGLEPTYLNPPTSELNGLGEMIRGYSDNLRQSFTGSPDVVHGMAEGISSIAGPLLPDTVIGAAPLAIAGLGALTGLAAGAGGSLIRHWRAKRAAKKRNGGIGV